MMNVRFILKTLGYVILLEALLLLCPLAVAIFYHENILPYLYTIAISFIIGGLLICIKNKKKDYYAKEGLLLTALSWLILSLLGALPFVFDGSIPSYIDAFFETVSGFTTTGSSILTNVETLPMGLLFWRSFTHWIGGMGILVFMVALVPMSHDHSMHVMKAEMPGPFLSKLSPRLSVTAKWLYGIYFLLTLVEIILLWLGGMPLFDSVTTAFATAGTGGFAIKNISMAFYHSPYIEYVVGIFMLLFGINFNVFFLLVMRKFRQAVTNEELRAYFVVVVVSILLIMLNIQSLYRNLLDAFRLSFFQVSSVITTTGFSTADFTQWPTFSKMILFVLMLFGACGGSTGGGIKISRIVILFKKLWSDVVRLVHPNVIKTIKFEGRKIEDDVIQKVSIYFILYISIIGMISLIISLDNFDFETTVTSVVACISNIGPGLGLVGPLGNFSIFSDLSKLLLSFAMLLGRLELYPMLLLLSPTVYHKKRTRL